MNRREFLIITGSTAIAMSTVPSVSLAKASSDVAPTSPDVGALYRESIVIDALSSPFPNFPVSNPSLTPGDVQQVKSSGVTAVNFTVSDRTFDDTVKNIAYAQALADEHPDIVLLVRRHSDIIRAKREGKLGVILGFQSVSSFEPDLSRLDTFRGLGVRIIQLSYNLRSLLGDGCIEPANSGLSKRGDEAVAKMNQLGIAVDLSHCGQKTTEEAIAVSTKPVLITHAGCSAVHRHPRNKDDRELKAMADRGGVMGVYFMPYLCASPKDPTRGDVIAHLEYALRTCGEDHVGIGSDNSVQALELTQNGRKRFFDDMADRKRLGIAAPEEDRLPYVPELNGPSKLETIASDLASRGYSSSVISKVLGGNFHRALGDIWGST